MNEIFLSPKKEQLIVALEALIQFIKLSEKDTFPDQLLESLLALLVKVFQVRQLRVLGQVFEVFKEGVDVVDIVNKQYDGKFIIEHLLMAAQESVAFPDEGLQTQVLDFFGAVFRAKSTRAIYNTQYLYSTVQAVCVPFLATLDFETNGSAVNEKNVELIRSMAKNGGN